MLFISELILFIFIIYLNKFVFCVDDSLCTFLDFNNTEAVNTQLENCPYDEGVFIRKAYKDVYFESLRENVDYFLLAEFIESKYRCGIMPVIHWTPESTLSLALYVDQIQLEGGFFLVDWIDLDADMSEVTYSDSFNFDTFQPGWNLYEIPYVENIENCQIKLQFKIINEIIGIEYVHIYNTDDGKDTLCKLETTTTEAMSTTTEETSIIPEISTTTEEISTTSEEISTTTEEISTTPEMSTTTIEITTTPEISTTLEMSTTTEEMSTTTEEISTTPEISTTTEEISTTTEEIITTPELSTTTEEISTTPEEVSTTTEEISTTTEEISTTTIEISTTTEEISTTTEEISTTPELSTTPEIIITTTEEITTTPEIITTTAEITTTTPEQLTTKPEETTITTETTSTTSTTTSIPNTEVTTDFTLENTSATYLTTENTTPSTPQQIQDKINFWMILCIIFIILFILASCGCLFAHIVRSHLSHSKGSVSIITRPDGTRSLVVAPDYIKQKSNFYWISDKTGKVN